MRFSYIVLTLLFTQTFALGANTKPGVEYKLLATNKTSTMEKELNEAAAEGFHFSAVMGGDTAFGGSELVVIMKRNPEQNQAGRYQYKLLATNKTSTMQEELQEAAERGFEYCGQTVYSSSFGGSEVVLILQRDGNRNSAGTFKYELLATSKTSTMQSELRQKAQDGFELVGLTVGQTSFGGNELVVILKSSVN